VKRTERHQLFSIAKKNVIAIIVMVIIISISVAGATLAWFTGETGTIENVFQAGTVRLSEPVGSINTLTSSSDVQNDVNMNTDLEMDAESTAVAAVVPTCKIVTWIFHNIGSKNANVRVRPYVLSNSGIQATISICTPNNEWMTIDGVDWWYYGNVASPFDVAKPAEDGTNGGTVTVCFKYCYTGNSDDIEFNLEAQAVQSSYEAYKEVWKGQHPW
jgi:hypothetical protein